MNDPRNAYRVAPGRCKGDAGRMKRRVDSSWAGRLPREAPKGRRIIAQDASPGIWSHHLVTAPEGRRKTDVFRPSGAGGNGDADFPGLAPWAKSRRPCGTMKQWDSALSVVCIKGASLDWKYLFEQSRKLDVEDDLIKLRDEGGV